MKKFTLLFFLFACVCATYAQRTVAFRVDMSQVSEISPNGVSIAGDFQQYVGGNNWSPGVIFLEDPDGNKVYTYFAPFNTSDAVTIEYKYLNGNAWGTDESVTEPECGGAGGFGNRKADIPAGTNLYALPVYFFNTCTLSPLQPSNAEDALRRSVHLFPNPTDDQTVLTFDESGTYDVALSNAAGQTLRTYSKVTNNLTIDRNGLAQGIYFVNITDGDGNRATLKLVLR